MLKTYLFLLLLTFLKINPAKAVNLSSRIGFKQQPERGYFMIMENLQGEIWKDVVGYEGLYKVSNLGRIFNIRSNMLNKGSTNNCGYISVSICQKGTLLHRIVSLAFIPNPENKPQVNHINGIKTDNRVENLEWATAKENMMHSVKIGTFRARACSMKGKRTGEDSSSAKLNNKDVLEIRMLKSHISVKEICKMYKVVSSTVYKILNFQSWPNVTP